MSDLNYPGYKECTYGGHAALKHLRRGSVLDLEGLRYRMVTDEHGNELPVQPGNTYIGARNTVDVYVAAEVDEENGWVIPEVCGYPFNTPECVRVEEVDESVGPVVFAIA